MESLVIFLTSTTALTLKVHDGRFIIAGHKGYLGQNICSHLEKMGVSFGFIDLRKQSIDELKLSQNHIIIDCSRINSFDPQEVRGDLSLHNELVTVSSQAGARYIRIASTLELEPENAQNPYVLWSAGRTRNIEINGRLGRNQILFVPNIYGGVNSKSVVDVLLRGYKSGEKIVLMKPDNFSDFLDIKIFINALLGIILEQPLNKVMRFAITSGKKYHIGSLQDYIHGEIESPISIMGVDFGDIEQIRLQPDFLIKYIDGYCTL